MHKRYKKNSILKKILLPMAILIFAQCGIFYGTVFWSGTINQLKQNEYDILNERVVNRKNYLESEMVLRWSNMDKTPDNITHEMEAAAGRAGIEAALKHDRAFPAAALERAAEHVIDIIRRNSVTGAFVILNDERNTNAGDKTISTHSGIYIRDLEPDSNSVDNDDLLYEFGPSKITKDLGIPMDTWWQAGIPFLKEDTETNKFFNTPMERGNMYPDLPISSLGYWSGIHRMSKSDIDIMTYTVPLISNGVAYGVLGIEVSTDYIRGFLPEKEISNKKNGAYLLAIETDDKNTFTNVARSGQEYKKIFGETDVTAFDTFDMHDKVAIYHKDVQHIGDVCATVQYLKLYSGDVPFAQNRFALIGIVEQRDILSFPNKIQTLAIVAMCLALLIGIAATIIISMFFARPISALVKKVRQSDPMQPMDFVRTNILEIDELSSSIVMLSENVADSSSKLAQIVSIAELSIGAFEYNKITGKTFCTAGLFDTLALPPERDVYMKNDEFKKKLDTLKERVGEQENDAGDVLFSIMLDEGREKWIKYKRVVDDTKILGVVIDVTNEITEKRKLEYERDHDTLTNLYNRSAFHAIVTKLIQDPHEVGVAALIMLDLDNLKYINDTYGHNCGDMYIQCTADALRKCKTYRATVSRMSGDEFFVFLYGYKSLEELRIVIQKVKETLQNTVFPLPDDDNFRVRVSAGIAWYPSDANTVEQLIQYADFAMYQVKNSTKGEFNEFDTISYKRDSFLIKKTEMLNKFLDSALTDYHFQPIVSAIDGEVYGYELLMRSRIVDMSSPQEILLLARAQAKLYQIERLTWFEAARTCEYHKGKINGRKIFINSIPNQMLSAVDISRFETLHPNMLGQIVTELTENEKFDTECLKVKQACARNWGSEIAIDDFGTGYNSEALLLAITPQYIKIDMGVVRDIHLDENRQHILQGLIKYAHDHGIKVIAEGVEKSEEMKILIEFGVDYMQGFYLGLVCPTPIEVAPEIREEIKRFNT